MTERKARLEGACTIWLTGLSGAGKSTLAEGLARVLEERGRAHLVLDGDRVRRGLCDDLGFSPADRAENIRRIGHAAELLRVSGVVPVVACISPYRRGRDQARALAPSGRFFEVWVNAPLSSCEARDPKGLYARARRGELPSFTGIDAPYEEPVRPEITVATAELNEAQAVERVWHRLSTEFPWLAS